MKREPIIITTIIITIMIGFVIGSIATTYNSLTAENTLEQAIEEELIKCDKQIVVIETETDYQIGCFIEQTETQK